MNYDALDYRYPSIRNLIYGKKGMVCTSQPLAAQAGLEVLKNGGNAVDAAIAASTCLTVTEPMTSGIGGDCFAMVWKDGRLYGLNGSGQSPALLTADVLGGAVIPEKGWIPVTVPGMPKAWAELNARFGSRSLLDNMQTAISYAKDGYPVAPVAARSWREGRNVLLAGREQPEFQEWFRVFTKDGEAPKAGELWRLPDHAVTLEQIGCTGAKALYRGELAARIDAFSRETGGYLRKEDLESYCPLWVEPVCIDYNGYQVWELPPNGHGLVALMALNIARNLKMTGHEDIGTVHRQIEAMKLAFADGQSYIADPAWMAGPVEAFLSDSYAAARAALIGEQAALPSRGDPYSGGTSYVCTADESGMMVSFIQSGYDDFGAGIVVPGTGINLQDRGCSFSLNPENPNFIGPGKRPYHTIIPGFLTRDGEAAGAFGMIGGLMQPQGHLQLIMNLLDFGMNPQEALNAPRWQWKGQKSVELEPGFGESMLEALRSRGHEVTVARHPFSMGRGQILLRSAEGVYIGATEPRADGCVATW